MEIKDTIRLVSELHAGQMYGNAPFVVHPMLVARHFDDPIYQTVALLHDVLEDTHVSYTDLSVIFGSEIADAVLALTRKEGESYLHEYIPRVATNPIARIVKLADIEENIYSATKCYPGEYDELLRRYYQAIQIIKNQCQ